MIPLLDIALQVNGFPINQAKIELQRIVDFNHQEYRLYVENKKQEIVAFHLANNTFYKNLVGTKKISNWNDIPVLSKQNLQKPLSERLSKGYSLRDVYVNKTSGSSGTPFIFAKDKYCHALTWASIMYRFKWYGINFNTSYQARFYGIPMDFFGNKKEKIKDFFSHRFRFSIFDLSDLVLERMLLKFKNSKFDYMNGYTSSIVLFAKFLKGKGIVLKDICPTLKVCMVTSEMLYEDDKLLLEKQFGIPIINEYGASELDLIAFQNPNLEWQVNSETLFVEILDDHDQAVDNGCSGRIVITSLYNKAHPFIRYDIGDIGILDEKSTLQKPILKKLIGRTNDIAHLPSGKKSPGLTFYYVTKSIIKDNGNIKEFIITQTKIDSFDIEYVSDIELTLEQINKIKLGFELYLEPNLHCSFIRKNRLERSHSGKLKQFKSLL